jgi:endoplasmic reticulum-Golgi intermediate compartment protein 3
MIEFLDYRRTGIDTSVVVDRSRGEKLTVHLNVTFPRVPCYRELFHANHPAAAAAAILTTDTTSSHLCPVLSLDLMDISGELQRDISHDIIKTRLASTGTVVQGSQVGELRNDIDKLNEQRAEGYCGSCYGGEADESGCCNSCDAVREAYTRRGWSFSNPASIDQVRSLRAGVHPSHLVFLLRLRAGLRVFFWG